MTSIAARAAARGTMRSRVFPVAVVCAAMVTLTIVSPVQGQIKYGSGLFWEIHGDRQAQLADQVRDHPDLIAIFNPHKFLPDLDQYEFLDSKDYQAGVIIDPCQNHPYNCCNDTFGSPQYAQYNTDINKDSFGVITFKLKDGATQLADASRYPDNEIVFDETCEDLADPIFDCVGLRTRRLDFRTFPVCWDRNDSVVATNYCRSPVDGRELPYCMEIAYTQAAFINECSNQFKDDTHCGTFLEIHKQPALSNDDKKNDPVENLRLYQTPLSAIKLRGQFTSGYRMSLMSLTHLGKLNEVLCRGEHEIWWVQRTRYNYVVEFKKKFFISAPECDWNFVGEKYKMFARIRGDAIVMVPGDF